METNLIFYYNYKIIIKKNIATQININKILQTINNKIKKSLYILIIN